jgi:membrane protein DedA with SNARE-associated domain
VDTTEPSPAPPGRRTLILIAAPLVVLTIIANVGDALAPSLVDRHPLLLIAMNARNRNLALTTNLLDPIPYYSVGFFRLLLSDPLFYLLGYFYGDAAVRWVERNTRTLGGQLRWVEGKFARWGVPLVFAFPNNWICLFAGAARMRPAVFLAANISGTILRLWIIRVLGRTFEGPIDWVLEFIAEYRLPLLALSIGAVAFTFFSERRSGSGELTGLTHLPEELEEEGIEGLTGGDGDGEGHDGMGGGDSDTDHAP